MSKDTYYFKHDSNARNDQRLIAVRQKYGIAGYGVFFSIIEILRESSNYELSRDYSLLEWELHEDAGLIKSIIEDFGLFELEENIFYSKRLKDDMTLWTAKKTARREAGKKGMESRWGKRTDNEQINDEKEIKQDNVTTTPPQEVEVSPQSIITSEVQDVRTLYEELKKEISANTITAENAMRLYKKSREEILQGLADFQSTLIVDGETVKTRSDYRRHFNRWYTLRIKDGKPRPSASTSSKAESRLHVSKPIYGSFHSDI